MNRVAFELDPVIAVEVSRHAAQAGQTPSAWIAANLSRWIQCDALTSLRLALAIVAAAPLTKSEYENFAK